MRMPTRTRKRERRWPVPREQLAPVEAQIARVFGLRADARRLDEPERAELVELHDKAETGNGGINLTQLSDRERRRFEALVERASDAEGHFAHAREEATMKRRLADLAVRARRPEPRPRWEERGAVVLSREIVFDWFRRPEPVLHVEHVGLLAWLLGMFENGEAHGRTSGFEGAGDDLVLVVNEALGLGDPRAFDPEGRIGPGWRRYLAHLERNRFFVVERRGPEWRIRRGPRALALTEGRAA